MSSSAQDTGAPPVTRPAEPVGDVKHDVARLVLRLGAAVILLVHGVQHLADPAAHIADTASFGVPLESVTGWLSMLGEAGLGALLLVGLATRVAGALAAVLMALTFLVDVHAEGLVADQGLASESALLVAVIGVGVALLAADRYGLAALLRLPTWLR